jgi:hypothetical protein
VCERFSDNNGVSVQHIMSQHLVSRASIILKYYVHWHSYGHWTRHCAARDLPGALGQQRGAAVTLQYGRYIPVSQPNKSGDKAVASFCGSIQNACIDAYVHTHPTTHTPAGASHFLNG